MSYIDVVLGYAGLCLNVCCVNYVSLKINSQRYFIFIPLLSLCLSPISNHRKYHMMCTFCAHYGLINNILSQFDRIKYFLIKTNKIHFHFAFTSSYTRLVDMESIDALVEAIQDFKGGLVVVSHDQYFITNTCAELWVIGEGKATRFRGTFDKYKEHTLERTAERVAQSVKSLCNING